MLLRVLQVLAWRKVPTNDSALGKVAKSAEPAMEQVFVAADGADVSAEDFKRQVELQLINLPFTACSRILY